MTDARLQIPIHAGYMHGALLTPAGGGRVGADPQQNSNCWGRIAGGLVSPIADIAGALRETMRELAAVLEAHAAQLDEQPGRARGRTSQRRGGGRLGRP